MTRFSANLGFLYTDLPLAEAIHAAHDAGFSAVECHGPFDTPAADVRAALEATGLPMLSLNTVCGNPGEIGLAALPGRETEACAAIDQAVQYADEVDAGAIHVMAGATTSADARQVFEGNLAYATAQTDRTILIEPLNRHDAPDYFLRTTDQAADIISSVGASNLRLMFDCYHVGRSEGDVITRLSDLVSVIGHIQIASVPDRDVPDRGELNYAAVFEHLARLGWHRPLGAEFRPSSHASFQAWLDTMVRNTAPVPRQTATKLGLRD